MLQLVNNVVFVKNCHFAKLCRNKSVNQVSDEILGNCEYTFNSIEINEIEYDGNWYVTINSSSCEKIIKLNLNTGAHVNVIPNYIFRKLEVYCRE